MSLGVRLNVAFFCGTVDECDVEDCSVDGAMFSWKE